MAAAERFEVDVAAAMRRRGASGITVVTSGREEE
jgi:hypothetical protein